MSKKKTNDVFGLPVEEEVDQIDQTEAGDEGEGGEEAYMIHQIIPAEPGWRVAFSDPDATNKVRVIPLVCFALIEMPGTDEAPQRAVRPMIADEVGQVEDVAAYEDFICLVPPGFTPEAVIARVQRLAGAAEA